MPSTGRPLVYACFGTTFNWELEPFRAVVEGLADEPVVPGDCHRYDVALVLATPAGARGHERRSVGLRLAQQGRRVEALDKRLALQAGDDGTVSTCTLNTREGVPRTDSRLTAPAP